VIHVAVVQETPLFRGALAALLQQEEDFEVVAQAAAWGEIAATVQRIRPDVVVLDLDRPDADPHAAVARVERTASGIRVLVLLDTAPHDILKDADLSTVGFITRRASPGHLLAAVRSLASGVAVIDPELVATLLAAPRNPLTPREQRILALAAEGAPTNEIARRLSVSTGTVRNCLSRINAKAGVTNRAQAIDRARQAGWL
jgi:two-component system, NarL family, response regulator DesR